MYKLPSNEIKSKIIVIHHWFSDTRWNFSWANTYYWCQSCAGYLVWILPAHLDLKVWTILTLKMESKKYIWFNQKCMQHHLYIFCKIVRIPNAVYATGESGKTNKNDLPILPNRKWDKNSERYIQLVLFAITIWKVRVARQTRNLK